MAGLSNLQVFQDQVHTGTTEVLSQQINLFNEASNGAIVLSDANNGGDFSEETFWQKIDGLVRRRNAYGSGAVTAKDMTMLLDRSVKVAAGTPPINIPPSAMTWINRDPAEYAAVIAEQLAGDILQDMLNTAIMVAVAAINNVGATLVSDGTAGVATMDKLLAASSLFGDRSDAIRCWVMHSKSMNNIWGEALSNTAGLFSFGNVNVRGDAFGRAYIMTDSDSLKYTSTGQKYRVLGLTAGAVAVERNDDYFSNINTTNGDENILRTWQAEWTYNLGLKGFQWDATNGGKSPNNSALGTGTNWDKVVTSIKDTAGVLLNVQ